MGIQMEQTLEQKKKDTIEFFIKKNILLSPDLIEKIDEGFNKDDFYSFISSKINDDGFLFVNSDLLEAINRPGLVDLNWADVERSKVMYEKGLNEKTYINFIESFKNGMEEKISAKKEPAEKKEALPPVKIIFSYDDETKRREMQDFVSYFNARHASIKRILEKRHELQNLTSINRLINKREKGEASIIGIISEKALTKNNNYILTLEDPTGSIKVVVNKNKPEMYALAKDLVLDEIVGVVGVNGDNIIFANMIFLPDIPLSKEMKRSNDECYVVFLSDLHVGSDNFLPDKFEKFLEWINGEAGSENQREIVSKVKYIFIIGDLVDGIGVYPEQDTELDIKDIYEQYAECARLLKRIPPTIKIIICPGNHDAVRISEPQPKLCNDFAAPLWGMPNVTMVSNPSIVNIHSSEDFPGFDVLMYHGYSFDFFVANVDSIRDQGGYDRADLIMKFLLQRRHLAPTHTATLYIPDSKKDPLVIDKIPDFFITGHIHKAAAANYRNITMICSSCWQSKTSFQEKVGHHPEPARVPIVNLQTRQVKILRF